MASLALPAVRTTRRTVHQVAASLASQASIFSATPSSSSSSPSTHRLGAASPSTSSFTLSLSLSPAAAPAPAASSSALATLAALIPDSLAAGLRELLPPWVFAVPKRRTTHGAKRMRASNKGLKEKQSASSSSSSSRGPPLELSLTLVALPCAQTSSRARLAARRNSHTTCATAATSRSAASCTGKPRRQRPGSRRSRGHEEAGLSTLEVSRCNERGL